jgi:drug/metabolite transporter (DMT)-like permease
VIEPLVIAAVLLSALIHAIWNAQVKTSPDRFATLASIRIVGIAVGAVLAISAPLPKPESWPWLCSAAAMHYVYYYCMLNTYRLGDFGQVYPIARGSAPLVVAVVTLITASEPLPASTLTAIALMSCGIMLLSLSKASFKAVAFALAMGVTIALYSYLSGRGIRLAGSTLAYMGWLEMLASIGLLMMASLPTYRKRVESYIRSNVVTALLAGVLSVGGYIIALWAMSSTVIAGVVALRETSALFGAIIGAYVLKEGFPLRRVFAAVLVVAGVLLLVFFD